MIYQNNLLLSQSFAQPKGPKASANDVCIPTWRRWSVGWASGCGFWKPRIAPTLTPEPHGLCLSESTSGLTDKYHGFGEQRHLRRQGAAVPSTRAAATRPASRSAVRHQGTEPLSPSRGCSPRDCASLANPPVPE